MSRPRNESPDAVYIDGVMTIHETDKALLVLVDGEEAWVPKSIIHDDSEVWGYGDEGTLAVQEWFAEREGWA